jgi:A/G-specific adenine glycosylase
MMLRTVAMSSAQPSRPGVGRKALWRWYEPRREAYPWRGAHDPYAVLVSEVMLQQTQAPRVAPAYTAFLRRFPTVDSLATATRAEVVRAWAGLGYNRRAVALSDAARAIVRDHAGRVPSSVADLQRLPGVGSYTAAAVASLAFDAPVAAVDTNVRRVVARVHLGAEAHDSAPREISRVAEGWLDRRNPGAWNSAVMDLGREVCRPSPRCSVCPLARTCRFLASGASTSRAPRRQGRFEGSSRQVRGAVVDLLRAHDSLTLARLSGGTGFELDRIVDAVRGLAADGVVRPGPAAAQGHPRGRVRLAHGERDPR